MWREMSLFRRILVLLMAAMILAFTVLTVVTMTRQGIEYGNNFLRAGQEGDTIIYTGEVDGQPAQWTVAGDDLTYRWGEYTYGPYRVDTDPDQKISDAVDSSPYGPVTIWLGEEAIFRGGYWDRILVDENGETLSGISSSYVSNGQTFVDGKPVTTQEVNEPDAHALLYMATGVELTHKGNGIIWFVATVMAVANILLILFPDFFFRLDFRYKVRNYKDMEPSDLALAMRPVSWVLLALGALVLYNVGLTVMP